MAIKNFEGRAIRAMLAVPLLILLGRQMYYLHGYVPASMLAFSFAALCMLPRFRIWTNRDLTGFIYTFGVVSALAGWFILWIGLKPHTASDFVRIYGLGLPMALMTFAAAHAAPFNSKPLRSLATFILACTTLSFYLEESQAMAGALMMMVAAGGAALAVHGRDKLNTIANGFLAGLGFLIMSSHMVEYLAEHLWLTLAMTGIIVIMIATIAESQNQRLQSRVNSWRQQFKTLT